MERSKVTRRSVLLGGAAGAGAALLPLAPARAGTPGAITVASGQTLTISETTRTRLLVIEDGGALAAPDGKALTVTVNGVETGSKLPSTYATYTTIAAGTYRGDVVITVADQNTVEMFGSTFYLRQALYVAGGGIMTASSVLSAVNGRVTASGAKDISITSTGEAFDGVYVASGGYALTRPRIRFDGNGRLDFCGDGAAIVGTGNGTRVVIDGADIDNRGVCRSGVVAEDGANVIVKNSTIACHDGDMPADYVPSFGPNMMTVPWMLGLSGNVRATNLLGDSTRATYLNSSISSTGWGVLSTDSDNNAQLTAINCQVTVTGKDGYGTYADGTAIDRFLGTRFDVASFAAITTGGSVTFADSTRETVAQLNTDLELGLTARELATIPVRPTIVNSRKFGVMWHQTRGGTVTVTGRTQITTKETTFLSKGGQITIAVDGSEGARIRTGNGIILQLMETDDPGSMTGTYTEPTTEPAKDSTWDVTATHDTDAQATFTAIDLKGAFYNGKRTGLNLALTFAKSRIEGIISASSTKHAISTITSAEYEQLGQVTNTAWPAVNNGVIVTLDGGSVWTPTGTSYITKLVLADDASVRGTMTVDGTATAITPGSTYTGAIVITQA